MNDIQELMNLKYWNNTVRDYAWALLIFLVLWIALYFFKRVVVRSLVRLAERTPSAVDDFIARELSRVGFFFYLTVAVYLASRTLNLSHNLDVCLLYIMLITVTCRLVLILQATIGFALERSMHVAGEDAKAEMSSLRTFSWLINGVLWLIAGLFVLSNLGVNISSFIAGLGIGGIAIALAAQSILGDFFSSLTILLDKPFRVGDVITVGDISGTVENIGIKTCRIRSVSGEQVVIGNSDLTSTRIRNIKRMQERRVLYRFGIRYETAPALARQVPEIVREVVGKHPEARFDRAHFAAFGDFALIYEVVYFILNPDYLTYMDTQQQINFEIMEAFAARGIHFAYPTQTIQLEQAEGVAKK